MMCLRPLLMSLSCGLILSACSSLSALPPPSVYDLGPAHVAEASPGEPRLQVLADPGLQGTEIVYRLMYVDAYRVESYRDSRWLAPPAELLASRLSADLRVIGILRLQLLAFEQEFQSPTQSQVRLRVRAWHGLAVDSGKTKDFELLLPASPNAAGAVAALSTAVDQLALQLSQWGNPP